MFIFVEDMYNARFIRMCIYHLINIQLNEYFLFCLYGKIKNDFSCIHSHLSMYQNLILLLGYLFKKIIEQVCKSMAIKSDLNQTKININHILLL